MRSFLATLILFLAGPALAQAITTGAGGAADSLEHFGQDVTVRSVTATAPSGSTAYRAQTGAKVCLDGTTGTACLSSSSGNVVAGANVSAPKLTTTTASGSTAVEVPSGAKACLDGATGAACLTYNSVADALELGRKVTAPKFTASAASGAVGLELATGAKACLDGATGAACLTSSSGSVTSSANVSAPKLTTTTASGSTAVQVPTGAKVCLDGTTGAACLSSSSGNVVAGANVSAPKVTATAVAGDVGLEVQSGAYVCLDVDGTTCLKDELGTITTDKPIQADSLVISSLGTNVVTIPSNSKICLNGSSCTQYITYNTVDSVIQVSSLKSLSGAVTASTILATVGVQLTPTGLGTCSAGIANQFRADSSSGGNPMRLCYCRSMGDTTYQWRNLFNPSVTGGTNTCPN